VHFSDNRQWSQIGELLFQPGCVYFNLLYAIVMYIVPVTLLSVLSRQMIVALRAARQTRREMMCQLSRQGLATYRHEDEITVMLIAIVMMFIVTQTPALITQVLYRMPNIFIGISPHL